MFELTRRVRFSLGPDVSAPGTPAERWGIGAFSELEVACRGTPNRALLGTVGEM